MTQTITATGEGARSLFEAISGIRLPNRCRGHCTKVDETRSGPWICRPCLETNRRNKARGQKAAATRRANIERRKQAEIDAELRLIQDEATQASFHPAMRRRLDAAIAEGKPATISLDHWDRIVRERQRNPFYRSR